MEKKYFSYFIDRTIKHMRLVQDNLILLEKNKELLPFRVKPFELLKRSFKHDIGKFHPELVVAYQKIAEYQYNNINVFPDELERYCDIHYCKERHHPAYHKKYNIKFTDVDLCEMCCDMDASAQRVGELDNAKYFKEVLINEFPILEIYKDKILNIFDILKKLQ